MSGSHSSLRSLTFFHLAILVVSGFLHSPGYCENPRKGLSRITPELLQKNIDYLASDALAGRDTPSPGLEAAARWLRADPARSVTDIAFACGFQTSQYFAHQFRRRFGRTPSDYREARAGK